MPMLKDAHVKLLEGLSYADMINLARLYEKEVDELVLKLFRITNEALCHQTTHMIAMSAPEIVQALLYERYMTVLQLFTSFEQKQNFDPTARGQALIGMLSTYHTFLRSCGPT
jgi:hypothetical protein